VQCSAVQCSAVQCSAVQCSAGNITRGQTGKNVLATSTNISLTWFALHCTALHSTVHSSLLFTDISLSWLVSHNILAPSATGPQNKETYLKLNVGANSWEFRLSRTFCGIGVICTFVPRRRSRIFKFEQIDPKIKQICR
jgi:hypothetical protein